MSQMLVLGGLHFMTLRILILVGWARLVVSQYVRHSEPPMRRLTSIDKMVLLWVLSNAAMFALDWGEMGAVVNRMGFVYTDLGVYFLLRFLIRDEGDVEQAIKALAAICMLFGVLMSYEQLTGHNLIGILGGIPEAVMMRDGHLRSQGSFAHPLLAGAFGATLVPMFIALWWKNPRARKTAVMGGVGGMLMAVTSMSSTSLIGLAAGLGALALWPIRQNLRILRWGVVGALVSLHLVMKAPVWSLIARIDLTGGSSGYHRYELINQAILRFGEWWLVGTKYQSTWGWDMWDSINWYVSQATDGGLLTLIFFVAVLVYAFKRLGNARKRAAAQKDHRRELFFWALGANLFANALSFIGIAYYDQSVVMWLALLTIISTATILPKRPRARVESIRQKAEELEPALQTASSAAGSGAWLGDRTTSPPAFLPPRFGNRV
jgi:VanZ family protein